MSKHSPKSHNHAARRAASPQAGSRRQAEEPQAAPVLRRVSAPAAQAEPVPVGAAPEDAPVQT
ncbi:MULTISPECIES: hypothetical protein, partial [unclassified Oscillibacter]